MDLMESNLHILPELAWERQQRLAHLKRSIIFTLKIILWCRINNDAHTLLSLPSFSILRGGGGGGDGRREGGDKE